MKILFILNYYYPYVSGLSEYVRILAEKLAEKGHRVKVLAANHANLPNEEVIHGVGITRAQILFKISKGTVSPRFIQLAREMSKEADVVNMHLPMLESGLICSFIPAHKLIATYHCDIHLEQRVIGRLIEGLMDISNKGCLEKCSKVMVQTADYASNSRAAAAYQEKFIEAATPIKEYKRVMSEKTSSEVVIGFCGRLVSEKGIDVLLKAFQIIRSRRQDVILRIGGNYRSVAGGSVYPALRRYIEEEKIDNVEFCGSIPEDKMAAFYSSLDVFVLPSINSLEAFGMVQIESMLCGTPVVATDLYGVRTIVRNTGMGEVVKRKNPEALAEGILKVIQNPDRYVKPRDAILEKYGTERCIAIYEKCFEECCR